MPGYYSMDYKLLAYVQLIFFIAVCFSLEPIMTMLRPEYLPCV